MNTYIKITFNDGTYCICEPKDVDDMITGVDGYKLDEVQMTEAEFDALPEFQG